MLGIEHINELAAMSIINLDRDTGLPPQVSVSTRVSSDYGITAVDAPFRDPPLVIPPDD